MCVEKHNQHYYYYNSLLLSFFVSGHAASSSTESGPFSSPGFGLQTAGGAGGENRSFGCGTRCFCSRVLKTMSHFFGRRHQIKGSGFFLFLFFFIYKMFFYGVRFRYESNHLLDVSVEEEEDLPPVQRLLQVRRKPEQRVMTICLSLTLR